MQTLPRAAEASHDEVMLFIETKKLWAKGIGFSDMHLIASALLSTCQLWTYDKRLAEAARDAGVRVCEERPRTH